VKSGIPIDGEAGVGYALKAGFDLPPLMFSRGELEALVLGARMVSAWADAELARHAKQAVEKVRAALPELRRRDADRVDLYVPAFHVPVPMKAALEKLRRAITDHKKVAFAYIDADSKKSSRTVRPLALAFWGSSWTLTAWCELRDDFRNFRPERIASLRVLDQSFIDEPGKDIAEYLRRVSTGA
jgi:predicted DNA-binding transcriptional regulator YafY